MHNTFYVNTDFLNYFCIQCVCRLLIFNFKIKIKIKQHLGFNGAGRDENLTKTLYMQDSKVRWSRQSPMVCCRYGRQSPMMTE